MSHWIKAKNIFSEHHSQLPVLDVLSDKIRIYYSTRKNGKSVPMYIDVCPYNNMKIVDRSTLPLLELGKPGFFDWSGVMPTSIVNYNGLKYMYYIGWSQRIDVPYHNTLGLAISEDGISWKKMFDGPVFGTMISEPGYIGTVEILLEDNIWKMWYLSCREWVSHNNVMEPLYDIKYATSNDGISWNPTGEIAIPLLEKEGGISAARILKVDNGYEIYFSARGKVDYRTNKKNSYRIYKAESKDCLTWIRKPEEIINLSESGWDDTMVCYPAICKFGNETYMFYNGNGFGKTGIGYATLNSKI